LEQGKKGVSFKRQLVMEDGTPRLYITVPGEEGLPPEKPAPSRDASRDAKRKILGESKHKPAMFFGHRIGKLLVPDDEVKEDFSTLDRQLSSAREAVSEKLRRARTSRQIERGKVVEDEEEKHRRFIEERNAEQEELFRDLVRHHERFETGIHVCGA
jgi:hypothetical protein